MADLDTATTSVAKVTLPDTKELLKVGVQFGHETKRWNPKMGSYIYGVKNDIHIIDISKTVAGLEKAAQQLTKLASQGNILFVGTKHQAASLVRRYATESGSYYMASRWVGGFFTNFNQVQKSLRTLRELEQQFEQGVEGRTKYEVSRMKMEWQKLNRMYEGVKTMEKWPVAVIVVDPRYESSAVKECKHASIPVFALTDTNCDPDLIDCVIPGNDDALGSIELIVKTLAEAVKAGNEGKGIQHNIKDYSRVEVKIIRKLEAESGEKAKVVSVAETTAPAIPESPRPKATRPKKTSADNLEGGILGRSRSK